MTTLNQAQRQLDKLHQRRDGPPPVTRIDFIDPETGEPFQIYEILPGRGFTLTYNTKGPTDLDLER